MASAQTLAALKAATQSKSSEEKQTLNRERDVLVLVLAHLRAFGYFSTASEFQKEGGAVLSRYEVADNMDLIRLMASSEEYYVAKFGCKPIFTRKLNDSSDEKGLNKSVKGRCAAASRRRISLQIQGDESTRSSIVDSIQNRIRTISNDSGKHGAKVPVETSSLGTETIESTSPTGEDFEDVVTGSSLYFHRGGANTRDGQQTLSSIVEDHETEHPRLLKPLPFGDDAELRSLAATLQRDILQRSPGVSWEDVVELDEAKRLLQEAVTYPLKYPQLFTGLLSPWCGILLYGPPGTGKTLLAKALASQSRTTFFNISASSIVSKYRGDSEKLVRVLFDLARYYAPSTIFLDEIDSIMGHRGGGSASGGGEGYEHEGSRRMKTELLIQMDGLSRGSEHVFVLAASNLPWDLDLALLRRLEKRIFIPLPNEAARKSMLQIYLSKQHSPIESGFDFDKAASETEGYSGADIKLLCKEVAMRPVRRLLARLDELHSSDASNSLAGISEKQISQLMKHNPIMATDMQMSLMCTNPSSGKNQCAKYLEWTKDFGST